MTMKIDSIKFVYVPHLSQDAQKILEIARLYYATTEDIVREALLLSVKLYVPKKAKYSELKNIIVSLDKVEDLKTVLLGDSAYMTTSKDMAEDAVNFVNEFFSRQNEDFMVDSIGKKTIRITRKYGLTKTTLSKMFDDKSSSEIKELFESGFVDTFMNGLVRKKFINELVSLRKDFLDEKSNIKVDVSNVMDMSGPTDRIQNNRFKNVLVTFTIPINNLDTVNLVSIMSVVHRLNKVFDNFIG